MKSKGEEIKRLIPQRKPFIMVDEFEQHDDNTAATALIIKSSNYFLLPDDTLSETGVIEHVAQSCSALAGCRSTGETPPVGMIVEIKNCQFSRRPLSGERIETLVTFGFSFGNMTLAHGVSSVGGSQIAEMDLKIFMR